MTCLPDMFLGDRNLRHLIQSPAKQIRGGRRVLGKSDPALEDETSQRPVDEAMSERRGMRDRAQRAQSWLVYYGQTEFNRHAVRSAPMPPSSNGWNHSGVWTRSDPGTTGRINHLARGPSRIVRCEEGNDVGDVLRPADTGEDRECFGASARFR